MSRGVQGAHWSLVGLQWVGGSAARPPPPQLCRDSSDEDTVGLWLGAVRALQGQEQGRLLQQHIRKVVGGWGGSRRLPPELAARLRAQLKEEASRESDGGSSGMDGEDSSISR